MKLSKHSLHETGNAYVFWLRTRSDLTLTMLTQGLSSRPLAFERFKLRLPSYKGSRFRISRRLPYHRASMRRPQQAVNEQFDGKWQCLVLVQPSFIL